MVRIFLLVIFFLATPIMDAEIYRQVQPDGSVQYRDTPQTDGEAIELPSLPVIETEATPLIFNKTPPPPAQTSHSIKIVAPKEGTVIRSGEGALLVKVNWQSDTARGWRLQLDGQVLDGMQQNEIRQLTGLVRGRHVLQAWLVDKQGQELARSEKRVFHMKRPRLPLQP